MQSLRATAHHEGCTRRLSDRPITAAWTRACSCCDQSSFASPCRARAIALACRERPEDASGVGDRPSHLPDGRAPRVTTGTCAGVLNNVQHATGGGERVALRHREGPAEQVGQVRYRLLMMQVDDAHAGRRPSLGDSSLERKVGQTGAEKTCVVLYGNRVQGWPVATRLPRRPPHAAALCVRSVARPALDEVVQLVRDLVVDLVDKAVG